MPGALAAKTRPGASVYAAKASLVPSGDHAGKSEVHPKFVSCSTSEPSAAIVKISPRVHDLRHTFGVNTLLGWYRDGVDVQARLPALSTYLGHRKPSSTYHYLSAAPELLAHAAGLLDVAREVAS